MIYILLAIIVIVIIYDRGHKSDQVEGSKYFYISDGKSKEAYRKMYDDKISDDKLKKFIKMEDRFLRYEKDSICLETTSQIVQATILSNKIKSMFPKYNFSYHTIHLKRISEPKKNTRLKIKCP